MSRPRRRIRWVKPAIQARVMAYLFATSTIVLGSYMLFSFIGLWSMSQEATPPERAILEQVTSLLLGECLMAVLLAGCVAIFVGLYSSFRFAGPLLRVTHYLETMARRRWDEPCRVRETDELQDLAAAVNTAVSTLTQVIREQQSALESAERALESGGEEERQRFQSEVERVRETYRDHLGSVQDEATVESETVEEPSVV